jgi:outer membrane protein OmpA-like peptidoglycan-associated protein
MIVTSVTSPRPSPFMIACLTLGLADLMFLNLVVFPRVADDGVAGPVPTTLVAAALPEAAPLPTSLHDEPAPPPPQPQPQPAEPPFARPARVVSDFQEAVLFETGRAKLDKEGRALVDRLASRLTTLPARPVVIEGHADLRGEEDLNDQLSRARARSVLRRLVTLGVPRDRIVLRAYGSRRPVARGALPEALRRNRRVEISIRAGTS